jgi:DnaK suppressor protein
MTKPPAKPAAASKTAAPPAKASPAVAKTATKPASKPASRPASKAAAVAPPAPASPPVGNRFTDRFAPARPSAKPHNEQMEWIKPIVKVDPKVANAWKTKAGRELTEPELLAMPDGEYMNDKQIDFFRVRLQAQKDDLLSNAGETTEHLREDTSIVPDPADRATIEEEHALELRTRDRERKLLKKIAQSLTRLDTGEYGYCDETGEPIGLARLLARPTATLSLEAQQRRELKQKMFGD